MVDDRDELVILTDEDFELDEGEKGYDIRYGVGSIVNWLCFSLMDRKSWVYF